jgi:hypothetical protein
MNIEIVNKYIYLGFALTTKLSFDVALGDVVGRAKGKVVEILRTMWKLGTTDLSMFLSFLMRKLNPCCFTLPKFGVMYTLM